VTVGLYACRSAAVRAPRSCHTCPPALCSYQEAADTYGLSQAVPPGLVCAVLGAFTPLLACPPGDYSGGIRPYLSNVVLRRHVYGYTLALYMPRIRYIANATQRNATTYYHDSLEACHMTQIALRQLDQWRWLVPRKSDQRMRTDGLIFADETLMRICETILR